MDTILASPDNFDISMTPTTACAAFEFPNPQSFSLQDLPDHVLLEVFKALDRSELCSAAAMVCRRWYRLAYSPSLWKRVDVHVSKSSEESLSHLLDAISAAIRNLALTKDDETTDSVIAVILPSSMPSLTVLDLGFMKGLTLSMLDLFIDRCPHVQSLNLEGIKEVCDQTLVLIASPSAWPLLEELCISHCLAVSDAGLSAISVSSKRLRCVNVDGISQLSDESIERLAISQKDHLERLYLDGLELSDQAILPLMECKNLSLLSVSFCENLTDCALGYIKEMAALSHLHLRKGTEMSENGFRQLFAQPNSMASLRFLNLSECNAINDRCIEAISLCCPNLEALCLSWCWSVTERGLITIVERLGQCRLLCMEGIKSIFGGCLLGGELGTSFRDSIRFINLHNCNAGSSFRDVPNLNLAQVRFIDLRQCNMIDDTTVTEMVRRKKDLIVINYYGEILDHISIDRSAPERNHSAYRDKVNEILKDLPGGCCMTAI
uniref:F-box domain-containing protein n=1 Tax=Plectus sambesii TaxID=2011161 RepID=A0A914V434_9BILA